MTDWQPIANAPKDGRFLLLHCPNGQLESGDVTVGGYYKSDERGEDGRFLKGNWDGWLGMDADVRSSWCDPTHWMPLPEPPAIATETQRAETAQTGSVEDEGAGRNGIAQKEDQ